MVVSTLHIRVAPRSPKGLLDRSSSRRRVRRCGSGGGRQRRSIGWWLVALTCVQQWQAFGRTAAAWASLPAMRTKPSEEIIGHRPESFRPHDFMTSMCKDGAFDSANCMVNASSSDKMPRRLSQSDRPHYAVLGVGRAQHTGQHSAATGSPSTGLFDRSSLTTAGWLPPPSASSCTRADALSMRPRQRARRPPFRRWRWWLRRACSAAPVRGREAPKSVRRPGPARTPACQASPLLAAA